MNPECMLCWNRKIPSCGILAHLPYIICMMKKKDWKFRDAGGNANMSRQGDFLIYCVEIYKMPEIWQAGG